MNITREKIFLISALVLFFGGTLILKTVWFGEPEVVSPGPYSDSGVERIISLAPSLTETAFLLGLGDRLVGVTVFCKHPPEAESIEKVGGYSTPDFEKIVLLKPDIILMMTEHKYAGLDKKFASLNIPVLMVSTDSVDLIIDSILKIGNRCGASPRAESLARHLQHKLNDVTSKSFDVKPRVLITVGKNMGSGGMKSAFAAGEGTYYDDLIQLAGGVNATPESPKEYANLSGEDILRADPDVIIDIVPDLEKKRIPEVIQAWKRIPHLKAVETGNIFVFTEEYTARPGPSFINVLEDIQECLITWNRSTR